MNQQYQEQILGDLINAIFYGFFNKKLLKQQQTISGNGIIIDDEFNFIFSQWKDNNLNGHTFIRTITNHIIYGFFDKQLPRGILAIHYKPYNIYIMRSNLNNKHLEWSKDGLILDQSNNLLYVIEITKKQLHQSLHLDSRTQRLNIQTYRNDPFKIQWKIKIEERCQLKLDGSLIGISKFFKKRQNFAYINHQYQLKDINLINIFNSFFKQAFTNPSIINPHLFLKQLVNQNHQLSLKQIDYYQDKRQDIYFFSLLQKKSINNNLDKKLGIMINITHNYVISLGHYDSKLNLSGLGIQYRKNGQSYIGVFKQDLLIKQYRYNNNSSVTNLVTFQIRQLLAQEHLKSLNYVHNCLYIAQICNFIDISQKIVKYISAFQKQFQKRNLNYHDSLHYNSSNSTLMNIDKYAVDDKYHQQEIQIQNNNHTRQIIKKQSSRQIRKTGFGYIKSNSKSIEKEQKIQKNISPLKGYILKAQKSPLRQANMQGKIYKNLLHNDKKNIRENTPNKHAYIKRNIN